MKILLTGSEGSLMQWTIKYLQESDSEYEIVGVDNKSRYNSDRYNELSLTESYQFHKFDLKNKKKLNELISNDIDYVIQGAATLYGVKGYHKYPADILSNDLTIQKNVLEFAKEHSVERVVYISSSMVYEGGNVPHQESDTEDIRVPSTDYGLSKLVGERFCKAYQDQYDINYTIWRPFSIVTPLEKSEEEAGFSHVFSDFIRKILVEKQNPVEILGSGEQIRCFTWIKEVAKAIAKHSFSEDTKNEEFNLGNDEPVTMKELAKIVYNLGKKMDILQTGEELKFESTPIYEDDIKKRIPSIEKSKKTFGWDPQVNTTQAIKKCIQNTIKNQ